MHRALAIFLVIAIGLQTASANYAGNIAICLGTAHSHPDQIHIHPVACKDHRADHLCAPEHPRHAPHENHHDHHHHEGDNDRPCDCIDVELISIEIIVGSKPETIDAPKASPLWQSIADDSSLRLSLRSPPWQLATRLFNTTQTQVVVDTTRLLM